MRYSKWNKFYEMFESVKAKDRRKKYEVAEEKFKAENGEYAYDKDFRLFSAAYALHFNRGVSLTVHTR